MIKMRTTIWQTMLVFAVIPSVLILVLLFAIIARAVYEDQINQMNDRARFLTISTQQNLSENLNLLWLGVNMAATELGIIDPHRPNARHDGDSVILSAFANTHVVNSWLIFEPNAFDGKDALHTHDYPGAPSGRYVRSFLRQNGEIISAPDIDEKYLDDAEKCYWYNIPKTTRKIFTDLCEDYTIGYDYGAGDGIQEIITVVSPIFRGEVYIGCTGQDILLKDILGEDERPGSSAVALLKADGTVWRATSSGFEGKKLAELAFADTGAITKAFREKRELTLPDAYSPFLNKEAFNYITPLFFSQFEKTLYLYAAIPGDIFWEKFYRLLAPLFAALLIVPLIFVCILLYLARMITRPIHNLTLASDAISQGNIDASFAASTANDEIGRMTRSLHRIVEQFRLYITKQRRSEELLDIYMKLHTAVYQNEDLKEVFDSMIPIICGYFGVKTASLVHIFGRTALLMSRYRAGEGLDTEIQKANEPVFQYHSQVTALLGDKKYLSLGAFPISQLKPGFADNDTRALCVLPVTVNGILYAYIILEADEKTGTFIHDDAPLLFIADTISYILTQRHAERASGQTAAKEEKAPAVEEKSPAQSPSPEKEILRKARNIAVLNVDRGLSLIGGEEPQYADLLRLAARVITDGARSMRLLLTSNVPAFAIEVHGMKGALYSIGADSLGDSAKKLELAAKGGDTEYCIKEYPGFEKALLALAEELRVITRKEAATKEEGSIEDIRQKLPEALAACRKFDSTRAFAIVSSLAARSYAADARIEESLEKIAGELENIEYDEASRLIQDLLGSLETPKA